MTTGNSTDWFSLMMKEYGYLQASIDKLDAQRFQIRNWAITAAGILFTVSLSARMPLIAFAGVVTTIFCNWIGVASPTVNMRRHVS
jgi:hypothetical protein